MYDPVLVACYTSWLARPQDPAHAPDALDFLLGIRLVNTACIKEDHLLRGSNWQ